MVSAREVASHTAPPPRRPIRGFLLLVVMVMPLRSLRLDAATDRSYRQLAAQHSAAVARVPEKTTTTTTMSMTRDGTKQNIGGRKTKKRRHPPSPADATVAVVAAAPRRRAALDVVGSTHDYKDRLRSTATLLLPFTLFYHCSAAHHSVSEKQRTSVPIQYIKRDERKKSLGFICLRYRGAI